LGTDDLEDFEADRELHLAHEYQDVAAMFRYAVETERRFYLANSVDVTVKGGLTGFDVSVAGRACDPSCSDSKNGATT